MLAEPTAKQSAFVCKRQRVEWSACHMTNHFVTVQMEMDIRLCLVLLNVLDEIVQVCYLAKWLSFLLSGFFLILACLDVCLSLWVFGSRRQQTIDEHWFSFVLETTDTKLSLHIQAKGIYFSLTILNKCVIGSTVNTYNLHVL